MKKILVGRFVYNLYQGEYKKIMKTVENMSEVEAQTFWSDFINHNQYLFEIDLVVDYGA